MAYVKLDVGILDSTLWVDKDAREVFITALLMAVPREFPNEQAQLEVHALNETGFVVPPDWYGFVPAAGPGIVRRSGCGHKEGMAALERLGSPEPGSRSSSFDGRRLIRIDGGYLVLNYMAYRDKDHTAAERMRRMRARNRDVTLGNSDGVTRNVVEVTRNDTEAVAKADADAKKEKNTVAPKRDLKALRKEATELLTFLNEKTKRSYQPVPANIDMIVARLKEGNTPEDCRAIIAKKCREWLSDEKMNLFLRPKTLFNRTNFAQYRGEVGNG